MRDTGEAFTCVHCGDRIDFEDRIVHGRADYTVEVESAGLERLGQQVQTGAFDETEKFRVVRVLFTPATAAMLTEPPVLSHLLVRRLAGVENLIHVRLVAPTPGTHTLVYAARQWLVFPGLHGRARRTSTLSTEEALDYQRHVFAAVRTDGETERFRQAAAVTTRHGELTDGRFTMEGNHVYLQLDFFTADAAGQNMATIAAQAVCADIAARCPVRPRHVFVEANLSGDKKASAQSFQTVRGRKVSAEVTLPATLVERRLHTTPETMCEYWRVSALGGVPGGTIGVQRALRQRPCRALSCHGPGRRVWGGEFRRCHAL